jgi:cyclase
MLSPRIIPCLLIRNNGLVKTVRFGHSRYIGDPINAVKIFNEKEADEIIIIDIDSTSNGTPPNFNLIKKIAAECRMPLCYGGGIKTVEQAKQIIALGTEKVAISSAALNNPNLISQIAAEIGSQSLVIVLDVKSSIFGKYEVFINNGKIGTGKSPVEFAKQAEILGAGEILINSIDLDGMMSGYDLKIASKLREAVRLPISVLGGAGSLADMQRLIACCGVVGAAAGSLFVFKGSFKAVLINYPELSQKLRLIDSAMHEYMSLNQ